MAIPVPSTAFQASTPVPLTSARATGDRSRRCLPRGFDLFYGHFFVTFCFTIIPSTGDGPAGGIAGPENVLITEMMEGKTYDPAFENNTEAFVKRLAKRSMQSERRRNAMVVISVCPGGFSYQLCRKYGGFPWYRCRTIRFRIPMEAVYSESDGNGYGGSERTARN